MLMNFPQHYATMIEELEKLGLSHNEARIYNALLALGSAKAGRVAKHAGVERTSTYNALQQLLAKGLASYVTIGNVRWFQPAPPKRLVEYYEKRVESARKLLPALHERYKAGVPQHNVRLYKGTKGIMSVLNDIIATGKPNRIFGSEGQLEERMPHYAERFVRAMRRKRIPVRSIVREDRANVGSNATVRVVPRSVESPVVTNIYADKIALLIWSDPPEAVVIENERAAAAYRSYFEFMWRAAKPKAYKRRRAPRKR
ncbi:TrmB family transcriptional regulator [Candidatus Woesearchaeota archaeon]|nr:MAG: TrmB family transcriptional regulator [Candidatus Woesearchaeota archaeon]